MITHSTMLHCYELDNIHLQNNLDFTLNKNNTAAWLFCIDDFDLMPNELLQLLSTEEKNKMLRYRQQEDRCRFLFAHAAKRILCNAYTGIGNTELEFAESQNKKPYLVDSELKFNLSHSGKWIALIFQNGNDCGIDTEKIRPDFDFDFFASKNYHLRERQSLSNNDGSQSRKLFFKYWARKEAWLKITGMGVFGGLPFIDTSDGNNFITIPVNEVNVSIASQYYLHSFEYENNYFCLCTTFAESNINIMNLNLLLKEYY